jgi:hypothetical protein
MSTSGIELQALNGKSTLSASRTSRAEPYPHRPDAKAAHPALTVPSTPREKS